jgi:hypothetical protein
MQFHGIADFDARPCWQGLDVGDGLRREKNLVPHSGQMIAESCCGREEDPVRAQIRPLTHERTPEQTGFMRKISVPLSVRAVEARIKRKFKKENVFFIKARVGSRKYQEVGAYFIVDSQHVVHAAWSDIQKAAVETEILRPWEHIE